MLVAAALALALATPAPTALDATSVYRRAIERFSSYPDPLYIVETSIWQTRATIRQSGDVKLTKQPRRFAYRTLDGMEYSSAPPSDKRLPPALVVHEFAGPNAWSMHAAHLSGTLAPTHLEPDIAGLKTIVTVKAVAPPVYRSELLATETLDEHRVYHLRLTPDRDPAKHNLHELWIDADTFDLRKATFSGMYSLGERVPPAPSDVTVTFTGVGPYWLVVQQTWTYAPASSGASFVFDVKTTRFAFPASLPDWLFDQGVYDTRQRAAQADILDPILEGAPAP